MANSRKLTATILSISLLTVMAGAAIAPALGIIKSHFAGASDLLIQLIVSIPALFIILTNFAFPFLTRSFDTRTLALAGLLSYVAFGAGAFFSTSLCMLLIMRALLGVSVGLIMPLSTGLLSYYYSPEEQAGLMGLSAAMNQLGGVVATLLAGLLANVEWNYGFLVYLLGLIAAVLVILYLPADRISAPKSESESLLARLKRFHPSIVGMLLVMIIFFVFPTNFAIAAHGHTSLSNNAITLIMVGLDVVAFLVGLGFGFMMKKFPRSMKYMPPIFFLIGYMLYSVLPSATGLVAGSVFIGIANGIGVPYLNTVASIKAGRNAATTVMPLLSMALYLGQFLSPLIVTPLAKWLFGPADVSAPFKVASIFCLIFLVQVHATRRG